jgi:predicted Rossmann fold flavoprotein
MSRNQYDVIVIGGGASGMMAAARAGVRGRSVLLLEKNLELGKKLSITGGGRCNITNAEYDTRTLLTHYGEAAKFLHSPFSQFSVQSTFDFFTIRGLPLKIEDRKRAFPCTESARDVTRTMKEAVDVAEVTTLRGVEVKEFIREGKLIRGVKTNKGTFTAESIVLATGGASYTETGSTGEGLSWLSELGHTVHPSTPDIVPLTVKESWVKKLSGKSLLHAGITFGTGSTHIKKTGKILFTHFGLSGPLILNASRDVKKLLEESEVRTCIDLFPDTDVHELEKNILTYFELHKNKTLRNALKELLPAGMTDVVLAHSGESLGDTKVHSVTKEQRGFIVKTCKSLVLTVTGTMGYDWAVVSDGGVDLKEVDTKTMASKLYPNLYFVGDVLHINRPSGGYSLQLCWTTGWVAGNHA